MDKLSTLRRATTWEISESEDETEEESNQIPELNDHEKKDTTPPSITVSRDLIEDDTLCDNSASFPPAAKPKPTQTLPVPPKPSSSSPSSAAAAGSPSPTRKRRSKEEIELDKQRAQERKEVRERAKAAKAMEKEEKKAEQQQRRDAAQHLKAQRPENILKCLTVCIDPALLQQEGSDILLRTLTSFNWKFQLESQQLTHSITWTRTLQEDGDEKVEEEQVLLVIGWSDFLDLLSAVKLLESGGEGTHGKSFFSPLQEFLNREAKKVVTILVTDSPLEYTSSVSEDSYEETLAAELGMDQLQIEEVLVHLQLYKNVSLVFVEGWQAVSDQVSAVTKALSKRPFKLLTERSDLPFCVDGSWASGARVQRDGSGLGQVWPLQLQQLNRVSAAVAATVAAEYQSPQLLLQAYQKLESEVERKALLAGLLIKTGGKDRRIGPEISSRVYRCFTSQNPQLVLD